MSPFSTLPDWLCSHFKPAASLRHGARHYKRIVTDTYECRGIEKLSFVCEGLLTTASLLYFGGQAPFVHRMAKFDILLISEITMSLGIAGGTALGHCLYKHGKRDLARIAPIMEKKP